MAGYLGSVVMLAEDARPKHGEQVKRDVGWRISPGWNWRNCRVRSRETHWQRDALLRTGHLQRGGAPTTLDRILATRFGVKAVQLANEGHFGSHGELSELSGAPRAYRRRSQSLETCPAER